MITTPRSKWHPIGEQFVRRRRLWLLMGLLLAALPALADPIAIDPAKTWMTPETANYNAPFFPLIVLTSLVVEFCIIYFAIGRRLTFLQTLFSFVAIHLIVFPIVSVASVAFGYYAEIIALIGEPLLFILAASIFRAEVPYLAPIVVGANLASFYVGLLLFSTLNSWWGHI